MRSAGKTCRKNRFEWFPARGSEGERLMPLPLLLEVPVEVAAFVRVSLPLSGARSAA
jgi:hypothetical protein